jgi:hypothetical protein
MNTAINIQSPIKIGEFTDQLSEYYLLKKISSQWSYIYYGDSLWSHGQNKLTPEFYSVSDCVTDVAKFHIEDWWAIFR